MTPGGQANETGCSARPAGSRAHRQRLVPCSARRRTEMGKIVVIENVTLNGVIQDRPVTKASGRAVVSLIGNNPQLAKLALDEALAAGALLLGRRSYEWLARAVAISQRRAGGQAEQPAQVRRVRDPRQSRLEQLDSPQGRRVNEVSTMKQHIDGDIVVAGSFQLVRTLIEHNLVDELRLKISRSPSGSASACSARPATRNPCASSTPRPSRAASPTSPTNLSGTPSGIRRR